MTSKYIDSHVKPFRCKNHKCAGQEFSSTACLLRHEREAHGLHGHGAKPHLCRYADCDRSNAGNGFPRHYNLLDHMRRVHGHKEEDEIAARSSSAERIAVKSKRRKAHAASMRGSIEVSTSHSYHIMIHADKPAGR